MAKSKKRKSSHKKHCSSKQEVFQMVQEKYFEKHPKRPANQLGEQQRLINQLKPVLQKAREEAREKGLYICVPDAEKFFPAAGGQDNDSI